MTNKEKQILLKDLSARLPYGVRCNVNFNYRESELTPELLHEFLTEDVSIRPYLRPISSMTEEEKKFYKKYFNWYEQPLEDMVELIDWLNKNHFDYRGLIQMGLALPAREGMYN